MDASCNHSSCVLGVDYAIDVCNDVLNIHALSNALHYGQAIFEGLKAFHCADGNVRVFNSKANAARLQNGAARLSMPHVPTDGKVPPRFFQHAPEKNKPVPKTWGFGWRDYSRAITQPVCRGGAARPYHPWHFAKSALSQVEKRAFNCQALSKNDLAAGVS